MNTARVLRDIEDGILLLDRKGTIVEMNPNATKLLGLDQNLVGSKYSEIMMRDHDSANDDFHQTVIDSLYDDKRVQRKTAPYLRKDGTKKIFNICCSILWNEDESAMEGVCLSFTDVTEEKRLQKQVSDSAFVFIMLLSVIITWCFINAIWGFAGYPVSTAVMSKILIVVALIPSLILWKSRHLRPEDMGLSYGNIGKAIAVDSALTVVGVVLMCLLKLIVMKVSPNFFPANTPFFNFGKYPFSEYIIYAVSVVIQEFISRGMVHESMRHILQGKNSEVIAIIVSSFLFGALHLHVGIIYMIGATALLGLFGILYIRQNTIWGLCIPHYVLGMLLGLLDFVAY